MQVVASVDKKAKLRPATEEEIAKVAEFRTTSAFKDVLQKYDHSVIARRSKIDDRLILRFIRAGSGDIDKGIKMFSDMLAWRDDFGADSAVHWTFEERDQIKEVYPFGYHKFDKEGRPIYIERVGQISTKKLLELVDVERMVKFHVQVMEYQRTSLWANATRRLNNGEFIDQQLTIIDLNGLGRQHLSRSVYGFVDALSKIDQNYFPEVLSKMLIINAPWVFSIAWKIIRPWLHERTKKKIEVVSGDPTSLLLELIDEDVLPDFLGGKDTTFLQSDVEKELAKGATGQMSQPYKDELVQFGFDPEVYPGTDKVASTNDKTVEAEPTK